jgi:signal-transduction protein with cAMP-binding, CBS, and nucleotidyltransferase domain
MSEHVVETHPLVSLHYDATVEQAAQLMSDCSMGAVGVLDPSKSFAGIFTERDLTGFVARRGDPSETRLKDVMNDFPVVVPGPISDSDAIQRMTKAHIRHLLVSEGKDIRIMSMRDLVLPRSGASK